MDLASASVRAAQYDRMSTEHRQYSPENQLEIIASTQRPTILEIVQDYSDHGLNGLKVAGREGLNQLIAYVGPSEPTSPPFWLGAERKFAQLCGSKN